MDMERITPNPELRPLVFLFGTLEVLKYMALGFQIPILTLFLLNRGISLAEVAVVMAAMSVTVMILELPTGGLADGIGRKRVYLISRILKMLTLAVFLFAGSLPALVGGTVLMGMSRALGSGSLDAWFVDEFHRREGQTSESGLQGALARVNTSLLLGLGCGTLLGGILPDWAASSSFPLPRVNYFGPYGINIIAALLLEVVIILVAFFLVKEHREARIATLTRGITAVPKILREAAGLAFHSRALTLLLLTGLGWGLGVSGLEQLWQPRVHAMLTPGQGQWIFGFLATGYFLSGAAGNFFSSGIMKIFRKNDRGFLFVSRFLMGFFFAVLVLQKNIAGFAVFYFILFFFNGVSGSPEQALFHRLISSERRSSLLSLQSLFLQTGGALGTLGAGFLAQHFGITWAWIPGAILLAGSSFLYWGVKPADGDGNGTGN
jgi:MFS family permease